MVAWLWSRHCRLALAVPARYVGALAAIVAATAYSLLAGFSVPTQRTLFMLVALALQVLWQPRDMLAALAAALLAVLLADPPAILSPGLWLSFGAVAAMLLGALGRIGTLPWWREWATAQWAVGVGLLPLLAGLFGQVPWIAPVANLLALPVLSSVVTPLALYGSALPAEWPVLMWAEQLASAMLPLLGQLARCPQIEVCAVPGEWLVAAAAGALLLCLPRAVPGRMLGLIGLAGLLLWRPSPPAHGYWQARVVDVGQGLAVLVRTQHHTMLYDTGPDWPGDGDAGATLVVPALIAADVHAIDLMMISHNDADHTGGANSIAERWPPASLHASLPGRHRLWALARTTKRCAAGQTWEWDGVQFAVFSPPPSFAGNDNDSSCVLHVSGKKASLLLPGDIGAAQERWLAAREGNHLTSTVLLASHHGSRNSSAPAFIEVVAPQTVIFSAGYRNQFHHPHPVVQRRFAGVMQRRTDWDGAITMESTNQGLTLFTERERRPRFWRLNPAADAQPP